MKITDEQRDQINSVSMRFMEMLGDLQEEELDTGKIKPHRISIVLRFAEVAAAKIRPLDSTAAQAIEEFIESDLKPLQVKYPSTQTRSQTNGRTTH